MRAFTFVSFAAAALFGSQVLAAPMEPHMIAKREDVCKIKIRSVSNNDCLQNSTATNYTLTAPSTISSTNVTVSFSGNLSWGTIYSCIVLQSVPSGSTCSQFQFCRIRNLCSDH